MGKSSEEQYIQAADWVDTKQWAGAEQYRCMMAACYTESLEVLREAHISNWQGFLDDLEIADECVYLYKNPGGKPRVQMPVLFMCGSYNWQLHVRLDTTYVMKNGKSAFQISKGEVPREFSQLMSKCHSAVGQDVTKDMEEFFQVVRAMFRWSSRTCPPRPIELSRLSALAGSACPTSLATTVLTWLGGLLPKNRACSTGDKRWGVEYSFLHQGLQFYLYGDIQQVVIVAWLMVAAWVLHLFPDMTLVEHKTGWDALGFLHYWEEHVVKHLLVVGDWRRMGGLNCQNREDLLAAAGIPSDNMFDVLRLCPDWPALTSGGLLHLHSVKRIFFSLTQHN